MNAQAKIFIKPSQCDSNEVGQWLVLNEIKDSNHLELIASNMLENASLILKPDEYEDDWLIYSYVGFSFSDYFKLHKLDVLADVDSDNVELEKILEMIDEIETDPNFFELGNLRNDIEKLMRMYAELIKFDISDKNINIKLIDLMMKFKEDFIGVYDSATQYVERDCRENTDITFYSLMPNHPCYIWDFVDYEKLTQYWKDNGIRIFIETEDKCVVLDV